MWLVSFFFFFLRSLIPDGIIFPLITKASLGAQSLTCNTIENPGTIFHPEVRFSSIDIPI